MITRIAIEERVREWGLREDVVEKDYVLGWVLWGIGRHSRLADAWVFKGGTCLKKCYIETYRFSEDLDFTVVPGGPVTGAELNGILTEVLGHIGDQSGINFNARPPLFKTHASGLYTECRIYYQGPRNAPTVGSIRFDLSASEQIVRPTVVLPIAHSYPDELPPPATVRCYAFEELFAEKIRAMGERGRPRDLYDIINLYRRPDLDADPGLINAILLEKCRTKGIPVPTYDAIANSPRHVELESEWESMLAHQLPALPPLEAFWQELPGLFSWLQGGHPAAELQSVPLEAGEEVAHVWAPPRTLRTWGFGVPLETVRFAASNHLCVRLGYNGTTRIIEPYSLRRTREGNLILHAVRVDSREARSYRVDRVQRVEATNQPFTPVYKVEFSSSGPIQAPPTTTSPPPAPHRSSRAFTSGRTYTVECPYCHKHFRRGRMDTTLNPHKNQWGQPCPGRSGFLR